MTASLFQNIDSAAQIELSRHGVIEASAGTGKTYTLIELVMRLLTEKLIPIEEILLVTFTEQATAELKSRIRDRIKQASTQEDLSEQQKTHLESALLQLNQAAIYTIHGFCQRSLKEFAFEHSALFETELVNDQELYEQTLHRIKRNWVNDDQLLKQINTYLKDKKFKSIDQLLLNVAKKFRADTDELFPDATDFTEDHLWQALKVIDFSLMPDWETEYSELKGLKGTTFKKCWLESIKPKLISLEHCIANEELAQIKQLLLIDFTIVPEQKFFNQAPFVWKSANKGNYLEENLQIAPNLFALIEQLKFLAKLINDFTSAKEVQFIHPLITELNNRVKQHKNNHGLISYNDMISDLWHQLQQESGLNPNEQSLTRVLQNKYQVALIDEFQDTDIRQWQIFKQIFLQGHGHQLWVIGDPKQAIYSFRGADVHTYHRAKEEILTRFGGKAYRLSTNFRTTNALISALNQFFSKDEQGGWFDADSVQVKAADNQMLDQKYLPEVLSQPDLLEPLNQIQAPNANANEIRSSLAEQIAQTIKFKLLGEVEFRLKGQVKTLDENDVCILVRSKNDAQTLEETLQKYQLAYTFHKKQDLYNSVEAIHFEVMLTALAYPHHISRVNNALTSLFFDLTAYQLQQFAEEKHIKYNNLWLEIKEAVSMKNWVKVFDLLLYDSGALWRNRAHSRRTANIKQLANALLTEAMQRNLEAKGLLKVFKHWRANKAPEDALHQKDTEKPAIKIMTMHTSKGLEFPVVFLFGAFSKSRHKDKFFSFYDQDKQKTVIDLIKFHEQPYEQQQLIEAQQLFYVAMTRAIFMLFLPGVSGAIKDPNYYAQTVLPRMNQMEVPLLKAVMESNQGLGIGLDADPNPKKPDLKLPSLPERIKQRQRTLHSFSSLSRMKSQGLEEVIESQFAVDLASELALSDHGLQSNEKDQMAQQIPGGVKTGLVLHGIFENIDFQQVITHESVEGIYNNPNLMQVIDEQMSLFKLENRPLLDEFGVFSHDYRLQLAHWLWHTLRKPLDALGGACVGEIPQQNRFHELSFYWNQGKTNLTGFIDLLFAVKHGNKSDYYILDWKSNLSLGGYSPEVLATEVMQKHQYQWQYQLYALAMQRWFESLGLQNVRLKGAIYLFSRGMDCHESAQNGVFYEDFTQADWQLSDIQDELMLISGEVKK